MTRTAGKALTVAAMVGLSAISLSAPAEAGDGWGPGWGHWHGGWGGPGYWGAGLIGLGVRRRHRHRPCGPGPCRAAATSRRLRPTGLDARMVTYCAQRYRSFKSRTGYFSGYDGQPYSADS
jgi:BA14K-like protein